MKSDPMAGSCGPMVGGGRASKEKSLVSPMELWSPTSAPSAGDDKAASQLLFLTVEYVEEGATVPSNPPLFDPAVSESLPEFQPRVASPLDSNLDAMARYSPIETLSKSEGSTITEPIYPDSFSSPSVSNSLDVFQTPISSATSTHEQNPQLIIMDTFYSQRGAQLSDLEPSDVEDFSNSEYIMQEASDKLLLDPLSLSSSELLISVEDAATIFPNNKSNGRIELLLSNGNIAYGLIDSLSTPRVLQVPKEYLVNSGRLSLDDSAIETDPELKSIFIEKSPDPKWGQPVNLEALRSSAFSDDAKSDLLNHTLVKESPVILHGNSLTEALSKNDGMGGVGRTKILESSLPHSDLNVDNSSFWCEDCNCFYPSECIKHRFQTICDKPVLSRARATLPVSYLVINEIKRDRGVLGVFARKSIPKRTQFGPVEGVFLENRDMIKRKADSHKWTFKFSVEAKPQKFLELDVSDDDTANWMKFVRPATDICQQNLRLCQQGTKLFYITTKVIPPKQELRVWYSAVYARKRNLPSLEGNVFLEETDDDIGLENQDNSINKNDEAIVCADDTKTDSDGDGIVELENPAVHWKKKNKKFAMFGKSKLGNLGNQKLDFHCEVCSQKFGRLSKLLQHMTTHVKLENQDGSSPPLDDIKEENCERLDSDKENNSQQKSDKPTSPPNLSKWHCVRCNLFFPFGIIYNLHMLTHSKMKEDFSSVKTLWICPQCHTEFKSKQELAEHASTHAVVLNYPSPFYCSRCSRTFANADRWKRHEVVHKQEDSKPYGCTTCFRRFLSNSALICHMKFHESNKIYNCPICKANFNKVLSLKSHIHAHCTNGIYKCPHCPKEYSQYTHIRKHIRTFHCDQKLSCQICNKAFPTADKLRLHSLKHSDHKEFLCSTCGKQFKRKDKLKAHIDRLHSAEREKVTSQHPDELIKAPHPVKKLPPKLLVSSSDYSRYFYKCNLCMVGFKRRGMLVNHLANRHPDVPPDSVPELSLPILQTRRNYYCQYCDKIYKSSSKRKNHILKYHPGSALPLSNRLKFQPGNSLDVNQLPNATFSRTVGSVTSNPHSCQWCHRQYASKAKLLQHQRKKHKDMMKSIPKKETSRKPSQLKLVNNKCNSSKQSTSLLAKSSAPPAPPAPPAPEPVRETLPDLSSDCGLPIAEMEPRDCQLANLKRDIKDGLTVEFLNQAISVLGPELTDLITYVNDGNGEQTCTLNLTEEQYMKIMQQAPAAPPSNSLPAMPIPLDTNSQAVATISEVVTSEPILSQSTLSSYSFTTFQSIYSTPFTAR